MNFKQLNYIISVDKHRNFKRASIECDVAQSTLSQEIQRLEKEFDIIIFDRSRTPVVPTLKGINLIKKAKEIKFQQNEFVHIAKKNNNELSGNINIAIAEILAPYITPIFVKKIINKHPKLKIKILELSDRRIEDYLINEEIDAAIMISHSLTHSYYEQKLYNEELCIYSNVLKNNFDNNIINFKKIDFEKILIHEDLRSILNKQAKYQGIKPSEFLKKSNIRYLKGNLETLKNIVDINKGTMFIPKIAINYIPINQQKNIFKFKTNKLKLNVSLISTRGFEKKDIIKKIANYLSDIYMI